MEGGHAPDLRAGERAEIQFQTDCKQKESNAEIRKTLERFTAGNAQSVEQKTGGQEADSR